MGNRENGEVGNSGAPSCTYRQDILEEVQKRGIASFTKGNDEDRRIEFMEKFGHHCQKQPCELEPIDPDILRKFVLRKKKGAIGSDGWHGEELKQLPNEAWQQLATLLMAVEKTGVWPDPLTCALMVGLRKPGPKSKGVKLRLLSVAIIR